MMDIVSIFCLRDIGLQVLQAESIARFLSPLEFTNIILVWHDTSPLPEVVRELLYTVLSGFRLQIIEAAEIGVSSSQIAIYPWVTQQAAKLLTSKKVLNENYLVLDSKNHFVGAVNTSDLLDESGRALIHTKELTGNPLDKLKYGLAFLQVLPSRKPTWGAPPVTPFILRKSMVDRFIHRLEEKENKSVPEIFLDHREELTEFMGYQAYIISCGKCLEEYFSPSNRILCRTLWGHVHREGYFTRFMKEVTQGSQPMIGIHWSACVNLSVTQWNEIQLYWLAKSLLDHHQDTSRHRNQIMWGIRQSPPSYLAWAASLR